MKKKFIITLIFLTNVTFSQKNENGKVYDKHPAISIALKFNLALTSGDTTALKELVTEDFVSYNSNYYHPRYKGNGIKSLLNSSLYLKENFINLKIENWGEAYPDAIEYDRSGLYVYTYDVMSGFDKNNGFKINSPRKSTFIFDKKGKKIKRLLYSDNTAHFQKYSMSKEVIKNGVIYKDHPFIAKVRLMMAYIELGDLEKAYESFTENARINDVNLDYGASMSLSELKEANKTMLSNFDLISVTETGYPDLLDYEGDGMVVISWWDLKFKNISSGKEFLVDLHMQHSFNDDAKIIREDNYYNGKLFE